MDPQYWLSAATVFVALAVPFLTFRLAARQEHMKWVRDQRLCAYVDFLTVVNETATFANPAPAEVDQGVQRYGSRRYAESAVRLSMVASPRVAERFDKFDAWFTEVEKWPVSDVVEPEFDQYYFALTRVMRRELKMHRGPGSTSRLFARDYHWRREGQPAAMTSGTSIASVQDRGFEDVARQRTVQRR